MCRANVEHIHDEVIVLKEHKTARKTGNLVGSALVRNFVGLSMSLSLVEPKGICFSRRMASRGRPRDSVRRIVAFVTGLAEDGDRCLLAYFVVLRQ